MVGWIYKDFDIIFSNTASLFAFDQEAPMIFSSGLFWLIFILFLPAYALLKGSKWKMVAFVVCFSLYFYYKSSGVFFLMLIGTSLVDWLISRSLHSARSKRTRLSLMWMSVLLSLSILGYFKYANFFLLNWTMVVNGNFQPLDIVLPVGISVYTFQSISYWQLHPYRLSPS